ncbi:hypothetical protein PFISCL1PPCAC_26100, partial [Pristionchus fissidentatus]
SGEIDFHKRGPRDDDDDDDVMYEEFGQCLVKLDGEVTAAVATAVNFDREEGMKWAANFFGNCANNYFKAATNQTTDPSYNLKGCLETVDYLVRLRGQGARTREY